MIGLSTNCTPRRRRELLMKRDWEGNAVVTLLAARSAVASYQMPRLLSGCYWQRRKSAGSEALVAVAPLEPRVGLFAPILAGGAEIGCWPLDLSDSFKAGRSCASS